MTEPVDFSTLERAEWRQLSDDGYAAMVGPIWERHVGTDVEYGLLAGPQHLNRNGKVHGGVILGLADHALGCALAVVAGVTLKATIQLDTHFVAPARLGDFIVARPEVSRQTSSVLFMRGTILVDETLIAVAMGVWKQSSPRS